MILKTSLTADEIAKAIELYATGLGLEPVAQALQSTRYTVRNALLAAGVEIKRGCRPRPQRSSGVAGGNDEIGTLPPGHPLYEIDQQILRARNTKHIAVGGWRQSSLANCG